MPRPDRHARPTRPSCLSNPLPLGLDLSLSLSLSLGLGLGPMSYGHTKWMSIREHIQVARVPRIIHLMFQKFIEEAYERHLNLLLKGIWKVYLIEEAYERHLRGIYLIEETYERHISLSRHLRGIWEAYLIEKASERHLRGMSHWGDIWEASEKPISLRRHLRSIWEAYLIEEAWMWQFSVSPIKSIVFLTYCKQKHICVFLFFVNTLKTQHFW